jgi:AmmeMemoRadiSam system protein B
MADLRRAAVAGSWYPGDPRHLQRVVDGYLAAAAGSATPCPRALIAPHAGLMYSGPVAAYAYGLLTDCRYDATVLVGPSHYVPFAGVSIWPRGAWETPEGPVEIDETLAGALLTRSPEIRDYPAAHAREHSLEMQLPFITRLMPGARIVPLVMGHQTRATAEALGDALAEAIAAHAGRTLLVASSDLSHYQEARVAARLDAVVLQHVQALDPDGLMRALELEPHHACGGGPMVAVMHAARRLGATNAQVLRYADSGDVSGDKSAVVGYMAAALW